MLEGLGPCWGKIKMGEENPTHGFQVRECYSSCQCPDLAGGEPSNPEIPMGYKEGKAVTKVLLEGSVLGEVENLISI